MDDLDRKMGVRFNFLVGVLFVMMAIAIGLTGYRCWESINDENWVKALVAGANCVMLLCLSIVYVRLERNK